MYAWMTNKLRRTWFWKLQIKIKLQIKTSCKAIMCKKEDVEQKEKEIIQGFSFSQLRQYK